MHLGRYWSRKTSNDEAKWNSYELEMLAVVNALEMWKIYFADDPFKVVTDCKAFSETMKKKDSTPKIARWAMVFRSLRFKSSTEQEIE